MALQVPAQHANPRVRLYATIYYNIYISLLSVIHTIYSIMKNYNTGATCFDRLWSSSGPIFELVQVI